MSKNWIFSWLWRSSRTRQQYYRLESFSMKTGILTNGSKVKNQISPKTVFGYKVTRKTSFRSWFLVCTQRQCAISKDFVDNYRTRFETRISAEGVEEITIPSKSSYFFMVLWHGWSCKEVCGGDLWVIQQDDSTTLQSIYSMQWWWPLQRRRNKICWRIVKYMLSDFLEILILGKKRTTWYFMVSKQARTIHHIMDQGLWQQLESIDFIYISFYEWTQTVFFMWKSIWGEHYVFFFLAVTHLFH